jgi:LAO/AO transport system kinase
VLVSPGAGDELQGLKKGVIELADMLAINKADGDNIARARATAAEYRSALHITGARSPRGTTPVITYSALTGAGIAQLWDGILDHDARMAAAGEKAARRRRQQVTWMWSVLEARLLDRLKSDPRLEPKLTRLEAAVAEGRLSPSVAADQIAEALGI